MVENAKLAVMMAKKTGTEDVLAVLEEERQAMGEGEEKLKKEGTMTKSKRGNMQWLNPPAFVFYPSAVEMEQLILTAAIGNQ